MLEIDVLTKRFGQATAVDRVSLSVGAPTMIGVIGRSGAGKSTLLRMLNLLERPTEGRVVFRGREVTALGGARARAWQARCAMIFQQFNLVPRMDVVSNVLHGTLDRRGTARCSRSGRARTCTARSTSSTGSASRSRPPSAPRRSRAPPRRRGSRSSTSACSAARTRRTA